MASEPTARENLDVVHTAASVDTGGVTALLTLDGAPGPAVQAAVAEAGKAPFAALGV